MARGVSLLVVSLVLTVGCGAQQASWEPGADGARTQPLSFEEFAALAARPLPEGGWVVDGDVPMRAEKQLREFYELHVAQGQLVVNRVGTADDVWDAQRRRALTYCVSTRFGAQHARVTAALAEAAGSWSAVADVRFVHRPEHDGACGPTNGAVLFDVRPIDVGGEYLAVAFFPSEPRGARTLFVDASLLRERPSVLTGVLRHELGHALGFRHEHTRPEAGACFEDRSWRALTPYDAASVMHYPQCNGANDWTLPLTARDASGARAVYGAPTGAAPPPVESPRPSPITLEASVARGQARSFGPFPVAPGAVATITLEGDGDADLYVRRGAAPTAGRYDCRPYTAGSSETCAVTGADGLGSVYVTVVGYTAARATLTVTW